MALNISGGEEYAYGQILRHLAMLHALSEQDLSDLKPAFKQALEDVAQCWRNISNKYYFRDGVATFDINHTDQYCQFLLMLARRLNFAGAVPLADKVFGLNKMLNACDIYHEVALPACYYINHSIGIILGRATFGDCLFLSQGCTIGGNPVGTDIVYPHLGAHNFLLANAIVIGAVKTGNRVVFAAGSIARNIDVPDDSIVFGTAPHNIIKPLKAETFRTLSPFIC